MQWHILSSHDTSNSCITFVRNEFQPYLLQFVSNVDHSQWCCIHSLLIEYHNSLILLLINPFAVILKLRYSNKILNDTSLSPPIVLKEQNHLELGVLQTQVVETLGKRSRKLCFIKPLGLMHAHLRRTDLAESHGTTRIPSQKRALV